MDNNLPINYFLRKIRRTLKTESSGRHFASFSAAAGAFISFDRKRNEAKKTPGLASCLENYAPLTISPKLTPPSSSLKHGFDCARSCLFYYVEEAKGRFLKVNKETFLGRIVIVFVQAVEFSSQSGHLPAPNSPTFSAEKVYRGYEALLAEGIADLITYVLNAPDRVSIADVTVYSKAQASPTVIYKEL